MLSTIRNKATGLISYILIGAICLSFALWGINSYFEGATQVDVASVNGDEISFEYYQNQLRSRQQQMRQMFQDNLPEDYFETPGFKRQTLDQMIDEVLLNQTINERRYTLNDEALSQRIRTNQSFQTEGEFDDERYRRLLVSNNWTVANYEATQRQQGAFDQIQQALAGSYYVDQSELDDILKLQLQKRFAEYFLIASASFDPEVSDEEISKQYDEFPDLYRNQEQIKVDYVELSADSLMDSESVDDSEIQQYFDENRASFSKPEVRQASHILIKPDDDESQADEKALEKANNILTQIKAGADFAELAKKESADKGSANNGGDLGVISSGVMVKPFEDAVFALAQDEVSDPVKSDFGYHIIKLTALTPEQIPPFEEVKEEIATKIKSDNAVNQFVELAETFKNLAFENPQNLEPIADQLDLEVKQSDWFTPSTGQGVAADQNVRDVAFSDAVIDEDLNSEVIELNENKLLVLRKNEFQSSDVKPLDEVKEQITVLLKSRNSQQMAQDKGEALLTRLKEDPAQWDALIKEEGLSSIDLAQTRQGAQAGNEQAISKVVFEAPLPKDNQPILDGISLGDGYVVVRINKVEDIDQAGLEKVEDQQKDQLLAALQQRFGDETSISTIDSLREAAEIQIFEENL